MTEFTFQPVAAPWLLAILAAVLVLPLLLRPAFASTDDRRTWTLVAIRVLIVLVVLLALLRPTFISTENKPQPATIVFLVDATKSMTIADLPDAKQRWEGIIATMRNIEPAFAELGKDLTVKVYSFDQGVTELEIKEGKIVFPAAPTGKQTSFGDFLADMRRRELGRRVAAAFILSDGAQAAYSPRFSPQQVAADLGDQGTPVYTISYGQVRADRDVAVENLQDQYSVFVKNQLAIKAQVRIQGYVNKDVPVHLTVTDSEGKKVWTESKTLRASPEEDGQPLEVEFFYTPQVAGQFQISLAADEQPEELVQKNNQLLSYLTVHEGGLKVLYLESVLEWWEPKFLRRSIGSSPDVELDFVWVDRKQAEKAQARLREILAKTEYDVYIIGDVHASLLGNEILQSIADKVDGGKGLLMLGGYYSFDPGGYTTTPLAKVLPIKFDPLKKQDLETPIIAQFHLMPPGGITAVPAEPHFLTDLVPEGNIEHWKKLPKFDRANLFSGLSLRAKVILQTDGPNPVPLIVAGVYGRGRAVAMGVNSTWHWPMEGFDKDHKRFWRRMMLWLASKDELREDVWIDLAQRRFNPGADVPFLAGVKNSEGEVIRDAKIQSFVTLPNGTRQGVSLTLKGDHYEGQVSKVIAPGDYQLEVTATRGDKTLGTGRAKFNVYEQDLELANPSANPAFLEQLAKLTEKAGGRFLAPEDLPGLLEEIRKTPPKTEIEVRSKWQPGETPLDAWTTLALVVGLLTIEWYLRKQWGMV